jgi:hypothetical protein
MNKTHLSSFLVAGAALFWSVSASAQVAVVMAPGASPMSKDQVANLYLGRNFDLKPVDLSDAGLREQFYKKATDRDLSQIKSMWSRIVFSNKGQAPKELPDVAAVKKAVAADPKTIGYIDKASVDGSVKVVLMLD